MAPGSKVLDVACGGGRHLRWFSERGHPVTGVDIDTAAAVAHAPSAQLVTADMENGPWPLCDAMGRPSQFAAVVVTNYLWRPLLPTLLASLEPGGVLIYETFAAGNETVGKPSRADFLLQPGELPEVLASLAQQLALALEVALGLLQLDLRARDLRQRLLRALFEARPAADGSGGSAREALDRALAAASPLRRSHAVFEVLHAAELRRDRHAWRWRDWDAAFRDPDGPAVAAFAAEHAAEVDYQIFLQWLTASSYGAAQRACREAGMKVGLIADLAIGMDASGSHAWSRQHEVLGGLSVGAPPDYYAAEGQSWGLTTFSPQGLAASGFAPFIETLRASLRHVGGIRIDHVMGLSRLWLVPSRRTLGASRSSACTTDATAAVRCSALSSTTPIDSGASSWARATTASPCAASSASTTTGSDA